LPSRFPYQGIVDELRASILEGRPAGGAYGLIEDPDGPIVVRTLRTVYDVQDRVVAVQDTVAAADKHRFRYEVRMR
jgi:hypothetical protein